MMRRLLGLAAGLGVFTCLLLACVPAFAADEITIDHVDSREGTVSVLLAVDRLPPGTAVDPSTVTVTLDGEPAEATATTVEAGEIQRTTVLVIDASNSMRGHRIASAQAAAKAFLDAAPADIQVGLVTFAEGVQETVAPTTDHDLIAAAIDDIKLSRRTAVYDAMVEAINLGGTEGARSVLVLSDGADTHSGADDTEVAAAAKDSGVIVDVVSLDQSPQHQARLASISEASGGKVIGAEAKALSDVFTAQAEALASQLLVAFSSPSTADSEASLDVSLVAGGVTYSDGAFVSLHAEGDTGPRTVDLGDPLVSRSMMLIGALALGLGLAGLLAVVLTSGRGPSATERRLNAYLGSRDGARPRGEGEPALPALKDSAVALADKVVKGDFESRINQRLAGAGSTLTASEWLLAHAGIAIAASFVGFVLRGAPLMVVLFVVGLLVPWLYLRRKHSKRLTAFNAQLAETLTLMAGGLSAGLSLPQAVDTVVREGHEPMAGELKRALIEQRLGVGVEEALDGVADRMNSEDFGWVVMAIRIQREVGGNLAELLNTVADTLRERDYLRRQVKVLSAEGRMSAYVLGGLPIAMFIYMLLVRPDAVRPLYTEPMGMVMAAVAFLMLSAGFFVMSKIVKVEV